MPTINSVIAEFNGVEERINKAMRSTVTSAASSIMRRLWVNSPVITGMYQQGWRLTRARSDNNTTQVRIINKVPYASVLDFGVDPNDLSHSWVRSIAKGSSKKLKKASGIIPKAVRIWSVNAVGGASARSITNGMVRDIGRNVADNIIGAIKKR